MRCAEVGNMKEALRSWPRLCQLIRFQSILSAGRVLAWQSWWYRVSTSNTPHSGATLQKDTPFSLFYILYSTSLWETVPENRWQAHDWASCRYTPYQFRQCFLATKVASYCLATTRQIHWFLHVLAISLSTTDSKLGRPLYYTEHHWPCVWGFQFFGRLKCEL